METRSCLQILPFKSTNYCVFEYVPVALFIQYERRTRRVTMKTKINRLRLKHYFA